MVDLIAAWITHDPSADWVSYGTRRGQGVETSGYLPARPSRGEMTLRETPCT